MPSSCLSVEIHARSEVALKRGNLIDQNYPRLDTHPRRFALTLNPPTISFYCSSVLCSLGRILYLKAFHYLQRWIKRVRERTHGIETAGMGSFIPTGKPLPENPPAASKLKFFLHHRLSASPKLLP